MAKKGDDPWVRIFSVTEPTRHKKGYTLYKVTSKVFPKNSIEAETQVIVWKRYSEFKKLHSALHSIHQNLHLKDTFPPFAKARLFGRFDDYVIEERKKSALQLLEFAAKHPPLFTSQIFVKFFEGGQIPNTIGETANGVSDLLKPIKSAQLSQPTLPSFSDCGDSSIFNESTEYGNTLGGIWQHRQLADEISLSSHATEDDDDDRTTFTDDDPSTPLPSIDLSQFDPLLENQAVEPSNLFSSQEELCNNWLLCALQSCARTEMERSDLECNTTSNNLEFPKPFVDLDETDASSSSRQERSHFSKFEDMKESPCMFNEKPVASHFDTIDIREFDPMSSETEAEKTCVNSAANTPEHTLVTFPLIPTEETVESQEIYLIEAATSVSEAQDAELIGNHLAAFRCYKTAINVLLQGVQKDKNPVQRDAVRRKIIQYLMRAEEIYEKHLPGKIDNSNKWEEECHLAGNITLETKVASLYGSVEDLVKYRVLGVLNKVLLVLDIVTNRTFVVKTLYKSPSPKPNNIPNIVPQDIPYMVQLYQVYETCYSLFLVLQYATGGRMWDYVSSYLQRSPLSPCIDCAHLYSENPAKTDSSNIYSGKKLVDTIVNENKVSTDNSCQTIKPICSDASSASSDSDLKAATDCPSSYVALFKQYVASVGAENTVSLAKCNIPPQVPTDDEKESLNFNSKSAQYLERDLSFCANDSMQFYPYSMVQDSNCSKVRDGFLNDMHKETKNLQICNLNGSDAKQLNNEEVNRNCNISVDKNVTVNGGNQFEFSCRESCEQLAKRSLNDSTGVELIISNSKTLLRNVDNTLLYTKQVSSTCENIQSDRSITVHDDAKMNDSQISCYDSLCIKSDVSGTVISKDIDDERENIEVEHIDTPVYGSTVRNFKKLIVDDIQEKIQKKTQEVDQNTSSHLQHHQENRSRLSSSTGSLEKTCSQRVFFSEVFHQMDAAVAQAATNPIHLPESCVQLWIAEMVMSLSNLHTLGIIWQDLRPDNILLGAEGHILLTYQSQWNTVDHVCSVTAKENLYAAPEVGNVFPVTPACDWWSLGALMFELLTGRSLISCHPAGITSHTSLNVPSGISSEATDLLTKLLRYNASERLGAGPHGTGDIKAHPFFRAVNWESLLSS